MESIREFIETETITKLLCIILNLKRIMLTKKERFVNKWLTEEWKNNILFYRYIYLFLRLFLLYSICIYLCIKYVGKCLRNLC